MLAVAGEVVSVFHSSVASTEAAIPIMQQHWKGPLAVYPEADRHDYVHTYRDHATETSITPDEFVAKAQTWVANGVQIVGGCCGVEIDYIRPLRDALPARLGVTAVAVSVLWVAQRVEGSAICDEGLLVFL